MGQMIRGYRGTIWGFYKDYVGNLVYIRFVGLLDDLLT